MKAWKQSTIPWGRVLVVGIFLIIVFGGAAIWIVYSPESWATIVPVVLFTVLGVVIGLFQWLFPVREPGQSSPVSHISLNSGSIPIVHVTGQLVATEGGNKISYRSLLAVSPPTDARTILQRQKLVPMLYKQLVSKQYTALALIGMGGIGKSTLAALLYRYAEEQRLAGKGPFHRPALWLRIDSSSVTILDLVGSIFEALGRSLPDLSQLAPSNQAATLFHALKKAEARLIVLDQFENFLDWQTGYALAEHPGIGEWLDTLNSQPSGCRILLTSRPWPLGSRNHPPTYMQRYDVEGLDLEEGVELLTKLGVQASVPYLRQAVQRCAGHAYALTLLASLLHSRHISLKTFLQNQNYITLWQGNVARNLVSEIYKQQVSPVQRKLLQAYTIYREPVPLEAAQELLNGHSVPLTQLYQEVDGLLTQHLLQVTEENVYQLHTLIVAYVNDHFDDSSADANQAAMEKSHLRAAHYYQNLAQQQKKEPQKQRQRKDVHPIIEAIWQLCMAKHWQDAFDLVYRERLYVDLDRWGSLAVLLELYQLLLPLEKWHPSTRHAARFCNDLGMIYRSHGQMQKAQLYLEEALEYSKHLEDRKEEGWAWGNLGSVVADLGHKHRALEYYQKAIDIHKVGNNLGGISTALANLGWAYYDMGNMNQALACYQEALDIRRKLNDQRGETVALNSIGRVYLNLREVERAQTYHQQALTLCRAMQYRSGEAWSLNNLGRTFAALHAYEQSHEYLEHALQIRREIGDRRGEAATLNNLGMLAHDRERDDEAKSFFEQALTIRREVGNRSGEAKTLSCISYLAIDCGDFASGLRLSIQAWHIRGELLQSKHEAKTLKPIGICALELGKTTFALAAFWQAISLFEPLLKDDPRLQRRKQEVESMIARIRQEAGEEVFSDWQQKIQPQAAKILREEIEAYEKEGEDL